MSEPVNATEQTKTHAPEMSGGEQESMGGTFMSPPAFQLQAAPAVVQRQEVEPPPTTTLAISASVGARGTNKVSDVRAVQARLNELGLLVPREMIDFAGKQDTDRLRDDEMPQVIRAITLYQRSTGTANPDGLISPSGGTQRLLNGTTQTVASVQTSTAAMYNHDTLSPISIRIVQNVMGGLVDGDLAQDQRTTGAWAMVDETDSQTRVQNFQTAPTGYDGAAIANAPANTDRSGYIEESTVAQVFSILVGANQHSYALYLVMDYYEDFVDAANSADPRRLSLGGSLEVYYDATLAVNFQAYNELGGLRTVAIGRGAFTSAANLRTCVAQAQTSATIDKPTGMTTAGAPTVDTSTLDATARTSVNNGLTDAVVADSIASNGGFFTEVHSRRIIQGLVGAPTTGAFDRATIEAIAMYQAARNLAQTQAAANGGTAAPAITTTGKLDPATVEVMGADLIARQSFDAAIQFAMDYFNINVALRENTSFGNPADPTGAMQEVRGDNLTSIHYDPTLTAAFATDRDINQTDANARIRDVRGTGQARVGQGAFANFRTLVTTLSQVITDIARPGQGQLDTEGTNAGLITPLADMSTFQVPYTDNWRTNGASGWPGATKGGRGGGHGGWDIYAPVGTPIRAVADGTADRTTQGGYGRVVRLLAGGRVYFYAHLNDFAIPAGQTTVTQGQVLGYVGYDGNGVPQRPHLHFEIRTGTTLGASVKANPDDFFTRPTKQRFYSTRHQNMIVTEIPNDTANPYPDVPQVQPAAEGGAQE